MEPWDNAGEHGNPAPGAATKRPPNSRGTTVIIPAGSPAGAYGDGALRLDAGTWDIRLALVDAQGHVAPPSKVGPTDPLFDVFAELSLGVGAARWVEKTGLCWRGTHIVRTADQIDVRISHALAQTAEARVIVAAQRIVSPAPAATHLQSESFVVNAGANVAVAVPQGARRAWVTGPATTLDIACEWQLSNAAALARFLGQVANLPPFAVNVPASAAFLQFTSIAGAGKTHTVTWEVEV